MKTFADRREIVQRAEKARKAAEKKFEKQKESESTRAARMH